MENFNDRNFMASFQAEHAMLTQENEMLFDVWNFFLWKWTFGLAVG